MVPLAPPTAPTSAPLACVVSTGSGAGRRRKDDRLAAVLSEFGWRADVADLLHDDAALGEARLEALATADLVVCDLVRPEDDLPVEVAVAATRGVPVLALIPDGVPLGALAGDLLAQCRATIVRYARVEPHRVLHARLLSAARASA